MKHWKKIIFVIVFLGLSALLTIYTYAYFDTLDISETRKSITIYDKDGNVLYESNFKKNMEWTPLSDIPERIQDAFVSVEDKRFYLHAGFDPIRIAKAMKNNMSRGEVVEGGSTITQQYAKNLFLTNEQTMSRKVQEFFYAARLEMQYSKGEILEGYLNTLYYGHGVYGIRNAAHFFFDRELAQLDIAQIAMLIGIPNGPSLYSPYLHPDYAKNRQELILAILVHNGVITEKEYEAAVKEELTYADHEEEPAVYGNEEYFITAVLNQLDQKGLLDKSNTLHVMTGYDAKVQSALMQAISQGMNKMDELECAAIVLEPYTSHVLAIAGGKDYTLSQYNRALYAQRQVASTIKPLLYYNALRQGFTPATTFISQPTTFQVGTEEYEPQNYENRYPYREISMVNAIAMSDNIYAVKTHLFLGTGTLHQSLLDFGIHQSEENPSEALGTVNMSVYELGNIYNTFASEGLYHEPSLIQRVDDGNGKVLYEEDTQNKRLLDRDTTLILNQMLTATYDLRNRTTSYPTMSGYAPRTKVAIKSGTSEWDGWVAGFNPQYTVAVWTGFDDNRKLEKTYYTAAKDIFKKTFDSLYPNGDGPWYALSDGLEERLIEPISGQDSVNGSPYWFKKEP